MPIPSPGLKPKDPVIPSKHIYMGIDPGKKGGVVVIEGSCVTTYSLTGLTEQQTWACFDRYAVRSEGKDTFAVIEKVSAFPKMGVVQSFAFGVSYGFLRGCLVAAGIPFEEVRPQVWQKGLRIPGREKSETPAQWKQRLRQKALQLFPHLSLTLATADAVLLAEYARRWREGRL